MYRLVPARSYYDHIAQDTVAMIVNDMVTLGALPLAVAMHLGVGSSDWFKDERRAGDLVEGWRKACRAGAVRVGRRRDADAERRRRAVRGRAGRIGHRHHQAEGPADSREYRARRCHRHVRELWHTRQRAHARARDRRARAPNGYLTPLRDGRPYGEALLDPTHIYVGVDRRLPESRRRHSLRRQHHRPRLAQADARVRAVCVCRRARCPTPQPVFDFIQSIGNVDDAEAYGNFNMGAGFAIYVPEKDVPTVLDVAKAFPFGALRAGHVEKSATKRVVITPKGLEYSGDTLRRQVKGSDPLFTCFVSWGRPLNHVARQ